MSDAHLLRRIEELAARAGTAGEEDAPVLAAALSSLRTELGALRADVGSLRAELGSVRTVVEAGTGKLSGSVSSTRADAAALLRRQDELTGRLETVAAAVDDVRTALPGVARAIQDGRGGDAVLAELKRLGELVTQRLETVTGDLRRSLTTGLDAVGAGSRAAESALAEARTVIEERIATVEDAVDGLAERLEALSREGAHTTVERLDRLTELLSAPRPAAAPGDSADLQVALDELADAVRGAMTELGQAVDRGLQSVGGTVQDAVGSTGQFRELRAELTELRDVLDELRHSVDGVEGSVLDRLDRSVAGLDGKLAETGGFLTAMQEALEARLGELRATGGGAEPAELAELADTLTRVEAATDSVRGAFAGELGALRADLADALEEVRDEVAGRGEQSATAVRDALANQQSALETLTAELRGAVLDRLEEIRAATVTAVGAMQVDVTESGRATRALADRLPVVEESVERFGSVVEEVLSDWAGRSDAAAQRAEESARAAVAGLREEIGDAAGSLRSVLGRAGGQVGDVVAELRAGVDRLAAVGDRLTDYLAERDLALEEQRDRMLHEVLDEFAEGLSGKERRALASRLSAAVDRRRDARDAQRWRQARATGAGRPAAPAPAGPDVAMAEEPVVEPEPAPTRGRPAGRGAPARRPVAGRGARPATGRTVAARTNGPAPRPAARRPAAGGQDQDGEPQPVAVTRRRSAAATAGTTSAVNGADGPAARAGTRAPARRRAQVDGIPDVPSPEVALSAHTGQSVGADGAGHPAAVDAAASPTTTVGDEE